jgi:hypothetical protein
VIAVARYKRNHDWMNQVFYHAAFGKMMSTESTTTNNTSGAAATASQPKAAYSIFTKPDLDTNIVKKKIKLLPFSN